MSYFGGHGFWRLLHRWRRTMNTRLRLLVVVLVGILVGLGPARQSLSEENADQADDERLQAIKLLLEESVAWYDVLPEAGAKEGLRPQIVLRWRNEVRINTGAAILAIWTDQGRPEAMASIFQHGKNICHEFGSLSRSKRIEVRDETSVVWSPVKVGMEFRDVPDSPIPAENRAARLRQMKSLAGQFEARLQPTKVGDGNPEVLRLLPTPLYRYDLQDAKDIKPTLRDGGMFAFVMGTDPEVILLLEAVEHAGKSVWQYGFARATSYAVEARLKDEVVWSVESGPASKESLKQIFRPISK
jgi:hypothetical protein